jgi:hypothetical protein
MCKQIEHIVTDIRGKSYSAIGIIFMQLLFSCQDICAQSGSKSNANTNADTNTQWLADSLMGKAHPAFDNVSSVHRLFFGENYRKE